MRYGIHKKTHGGISFVVQRDVGGAVIFLGAYALVDLSGEREEKNSLSRIYEVEMKNTAENLLMSLKNADKTVSYHYALNALEYAKEREILRRRSFFQMCRRLCLRNAAGNTPICSRTR